MSLVNIATYGLIFIAATAAIAIVFIREVFHAALLLLVALLCMAGLFVVLSAEFLAVVQIIVYAGGVLLLMMFGVMVTNRIQQPQGVGRRNGLATTVVCSFLLVILVNAIGRGGAPEIMATESTPPDIGAALLTSFAFPFELSGVLLLVSLIGAMVAATHQNS